MNRSTRLARIALKAYDVKTAQQRLENDMAAARREGLSLRAIADSAGMSHEQVRRLVGEIKE